MSSIAAPFGLRPVFSPDGIVRPGPLVEIDSGFATAIFQNSPVAINAAGNLVTAAPGARSIGVFQGVEFTDTEGRFRVANQWVANQVAADVRAYSTQSQQLVYEIQANATLTIASIGQQFDWTALTGSTITGLSSVALDVASAAANAGLRVIGLNPASDNVFGDAFPIVLVQISQHQLTADIASI